MEENVTHRSMTSISFPRQINLIKKLRSISYIINFTILGLSLTALLLYVINIPALKLYMSQTLGVYPFSMVLFILSATCLLFGAKPHRINTQQDGEQEHSVWWKTWTPILVAVTITILGFINLANFTNVGALSFFHISIFGGLCFFLIGLALIPPFTWIPHRFHITQFLIFFVSGLSVFTILESSYQVFNTHQVQHIAHVSFTTAVFITVFCFGVLIRWSHRGFFGNFTLDSTVSKLAFRLFLINLILAPLVAFIILPVMQKTPYNWYQVLTVVIALTTFTSSLILWLNVRFLYGFELEYLLMKESLHSHNIDLTMEKEALQKRMAQLEQERQGYVEKLNLEHTLQDTADNLS